MRRVHLLQLAILVFLIFLFYPIKHLVSPDWTVQVIDENDRPVVEAKVTERWFDTPPGGNFHGEEQVAGPDGVVHFSPHYYNAGIGLRALGCIGEMIEFLYHGNCGAYASVDGFKCGYGYLQKDVDRALGGHDWHGQPSNVNTKLFLRYCSNGGTGIDCDTLPNLNCIDH